MWETGKVPTGTLLMVPSQSSLSGNFVTIRWSGFNSSAFRPSPRIYHDLVKVPICRETGRVFDYRVNQELLLDGSRVTRRERRITLTE